MRATAGFSTSIFLTTIAFLLFNTSAQNNATDLSKRGLIYISTDHPSDYSIFLSSSSPLKWYYNFSPWPSLRHRDSMPFVPMIHGIDSVSNDISTIQSLSDVSYVLVFNEPDGSTESGGSNISPRDAAEVYLNTISGLRSDPYNYRLSVPATTGSPTGLNWLRQFNDSCYDLNPRGGCQFDFLAAHWYGDFPAMASWLGTLHVLYPDLPIWLTEFALPQFDANTTWAMMNQSLDFLDSLDYVERYSWFGTFREEAANSFVGPAVSFLDNRGRLTELGATYLGGEARGFAEGDSASGAGSVHTIPSIFLQIAGTALVVIYTLQHA